VVQIHPPQPTELLTKRVGNSFTFVRVVSSAIHAVFLLLSCLSSPPPTPVEHSLSTTHRRRTLFPPSLMRGQEIKTQNQNQSAIYGIRSLQGGPELQSSLEGGRYGSS
jgi:hypothetical protein